MTEIFDATILCKRCGKEMRQTIVERQGLELRAVRCGECGDTIIHPADLNGMQHFEQLKGKNFQVKLRMVGNSHAISIPKEIIDFMTEQQKAMRRHMDEMVNLCFEDFGTLRLEFWDSERETAMDEKYNNGSVLETDIRDSHSLRRLRRAKHDER